MTRDGTTRGLSAWGVEWDFDWGTSLIWHGPLTVYRTRREARAWIEEHFGYLRHRPDLRAEPFGWRMPRAVRVTVTRDR